MSCGCPVLTDQFYFNKVSVHMCVSPEAMQQVKDWIKTEPALVFVSRNNWRCEAGIRGRKSTGNIITTDSREYEE